MNQELQEKLFETYPRIFARRHMPDSYSAMRYGIQCPDHWYDLIEALCAKIKEYADERHIICEANQIKTKFGCLRFYVTYSDPYIKGLIAMAEIMSLKTKE